MAKATRDTSDFFDYGLDMTSRTLYIGSAGETEGDQVGVDYRLADRVLKALHLLESSAPNGDKVINIYLNNPGGSMVDGMAIYDGIKACSNPVTITVFGEACSMGCVILQAADLRVMAPNSIMMFHIGEESYSSNHPEIVRRWVKFNERFGKRVDAILAERIRVKHPELKDKKLREMALFDNILLAEEAVELGLADEVMLSR